jgi:hypothetical protein
MKLNNKEKHIYIYKEQKLKILIYLKNIKDYQTDLKLQKIVLSHLYLWLLLKKIHNQIELEIT